MDAELDGYASTSSTLNPFVQPLLTDLYQITMAYCYWRQGKHEEPAVFDLFFRKNPFHGEFTVFAGLGDCLEFLKTFRFTEDDIKYLQTVLPKDTDPAFFDYMLGLNCEKVTLKALPEGSVAFPRILLIIVEGPLAICQLLETTLLNQVNYASLVCTNATRFRVAAGDRMELIEFGLRRAQGADGAMTASKYCYIGGFDGTSNVLAGKIHGIPVRGTLAHSFISSFDPTDDLYDKKLIDSHDGSQKSVDLLALSFRFLDELTTKVPGCAIRSEINEGELKSFVSFGSSFPRGFLALIDTYDVLGSGAINFCACALALSNLGYKALGVRIDSGDIAYLSKKVSEIFRNVGKAYGLDWFEKLKIVASNDINEDTIYSLNDQKHEVGVFGIGTHLVTCQRQPALGCVYKLVQLRGTPRVKLSQDVDKVTIPGLKKAFRLYAKDGIPMTDVMLLDKEPDPQPGKSLLCRHPFLENFRAYAKPQSVQPLHSIYWKDGKVQQPQRTPQELKAKVAEGLKNLREDHKRHLNPTPYKVSLSENLYTSFHKMWLEHAPIGQLE